MSRTFIREVLQEKDSIDLLTCELLINMRALFASLHYEHINMSITRWSMRISARIVIELLHVRRIMRSKTDQFLRYAGYAKKCGMEG